jgi:hypothetical protein
MWYDNTVAIFDSYFIIEMLGIASPCLMSLAWNAVLNPLCTILFVALFRQGVKLHLNCNILKDQSSNLKQYEKIIYSEKS